MCDYSLKHLASRPAKVGDKLVTSKGLNGLGYAGGMTTGLFAPEDLMTAVCVLPGTELAFADKAKKAPSQWDKIKALFGLTVNTDRHATFCQINKELPYAHHDAVKFSDDSIVLVHDLELGQEITVLQLPAQAKTADEAKERERLEVVA